MIPFNVEEYSLVNKPARYRKMKAEVQFQYESMTAVVLIYEHLPKGTPLLLGAWPLYATQGFYC